MSSLRFVLSSPKHRLSKHFDGLMREDLVFQNVRVAKGFGPILIAREFHNAKRGEEFATHWETEDVSAEDFYGNYVTIHNLNDGLVSQMKEWNERNPDNKYTDSIFIGRSQDLRTHIQVPTEQFSRLLQINWKECFVNLTFGTKGSIEGLRLGFSEEDKKTLRVGGEIFNDDINLEITDYAIEIEVLRNNTMIGPVDSTRFHIMSRLFRFVFGR